MKKAATQVSTGIYARSGVSLPEMPTPPPSIEVFPGVHARLCSDMTRFSSGNLVMSMFDCEISTKGKPLGAMTTDIVGRWYVRVDKSLYEVPMNEIFGAYMDAHNKAAEPEIGTARRRAAKEMGLELPSKTFTIEVTDEELSVLDAAFEVLTKGGGQYVMLGFPDIVALHRSLFKKFRTLAGK